ncbi:MAG: alkaline phosphatase family protein, partial [Thermoproteota archaeon]|nr:alkaline phosphatase family protein [Thermoproteota archaeon]
IPYLPTNTAPGHTCIYTGSIPAIHGIVGNNWFDKSTGKNIYCTYDSTVLPVGGSNTWGKESPRNLLTTTIGDELRLSNNFKSKVFGISLKDRASILPAGRSANAAFWYDESLGKWITSNYYMNELPEWLKKINDENLPDKYMSKDWNTLLPINMYNLSTKDSVIFEQQIPGENSVIFPHKLSQIKNKKYEAFKTTPFANTFTLHLAKKLIENEKLGTNSVTDFLAINISSTDFIGHAFGPNSIEVEDAYLRLDIDIADFLKNLDNKLGKGNYLLFLSADHGVAHVPGFLEEHNLPGGLMNQSVLRNDINKFLENSYSIKNGVLNIQNYDLYLNTSELVKKHNWMEIKQAIIDYLKQQPYIIDAFENEKLATTTIPEPIKQRLINGYNNQRSGDIHLLLKPGFIDRSPMGATHGSWYPYDSHIPLIWFGWNIQHGITNRETYMTDIAPTIAALLKIQMPSGSVGKVIEEVVK